MATEQRNQQGTGKHPHKSTNEPWPHTGKGNEKAPPRKRPPSELRSKGAEPGTEGASEAEDADANADEESDATADEESDTTADEESDATADEESDAIADEESEDEQDTYVSTLLAIAQMDSEAAMAYETAAELVSSPEIRARLEEFAGDHRRHIDELGQMIEDIGGDAELAAPPPETSVFSLLTIAVASLGDQAILMALVGNEQFTNATYSMALELVTDTETVALLQGNLTDEQRHISWLSKQTSAQTDGLEEGDAAEE